MKFVKAALGIAAAIALIGFGIGSTDMMPYYAVVFLDDTNKTFIALPCIDEWRSRPTTTVDVVRRGTAGEAYKLGYKVDDECREAGGYAEDGRSLPLSLIGGIGPIEPKMVLSFIPASEQWPLVIRCGETQTAPSRPWPNCASTAHGHGSIATSACITRPSRSCRS
jgi:hypothetical protein